MTGAWVPSGMQVLPKVADAGLFQRLHQATGNHALAERESHIEMPSAHYGFAFFGNVWMVLNS